MAGGGFVLEFSVDGDIQIARGFSRFADNIKDMSEAFEEMTQDFFQGEERQFSSAGGYGAGGWVSLAPSTLEQKGRSGYPPDILVRTGALRTSLMGEGGRNIKVVEPLMMRVGTMLDYAKFHQRGTSRMPARPVIMLPEEQKTRWHKIIQKYLVKQAREALA